MHDRDKVIALLDDMRLLADIRIHEIVSPDNWSVYSDLCDLIDLAKESALALLREQEPRVMTLEEVIEHYSLPPVFVDDLGAQEDYLEDIAPLYFDFSEADLFAVHWRGYYSVRPYLDDWKESYGKEWRCWTARPTDEQREAVKWDEK